MTTERDAVEPTAPETNGVMPLAEPTVEAAEKPAEPADRVGASDATRIDG
jgi:hypothetical protein